MSRRRLAAGLLLALAGAGAALACGPFWPLQLLDDRAGVLLSAPVNSFAWEARRLVPAPADGLPVVESRGWDDDGTRDAERAQAEAAGLSEAQAARIRRMRTAASGDGALAQGADLPEAVRLYTAGAVDYRRGAADAAAARFAAVLALPADAARPRAVWATYMLGRVAAEADDAATAARRFRETRALARAGAPDPQGLAVASLGEEARLALGDGATPAALAGAVALYAEQAALGSDSGVQSLRIVAERLMREPDRLEAAVAEPLLQRLLVVYVLARAGDVYSGLYEFEDFELFAAERGSALPPAPPPLVRLVAAIERRGLARVEAADRLAALAYYTGRDDLAASLAARAEGPLAAWVQAKLALQKGDLAAAAERYAAASRGFPDGAETAPLAGLNQRLLVGERGVVALARGDYLDALDLLWRAGYWGDAVHVAERVLTADELRGFVDAAVPPAAFPEGWNGVASDDGGTLPDPLAQLRALLARRLVREGRVGEALPYFDDPARRAEAQAYRIALFAAETGWGRGARARAWFEAAVLARESGMELMGTEWEPDYAIWDGNLSAGFDPQKRMSGPLVSADERARFAARAAELPTLRFHYRYEAVAMAERAADLLPPRSQAFAAVLCRAAGWMMQTPGAEARVAALWRRYVREGAVVPFAPTFGRDCPDPDFDAADGLWRRRLAAALHDAASRHRWPLALGLGLALLALAGWRALSSTRADRRQP